MMPTLQLIGAHHYFDFKGHGSWVEFLAANFGDVDMTSSTIEFWVPVQFSEKSIIWNFSNTLMKNVK